MKEAKRICRILNVDIEKKIHELSLGNRKKVSIVCAMQHKPKLLIFDEPFSGFDPINVNLLKKEILELRDKGATIIFSTHNMSSVEELCDNIMLINKGEKILEGSVYQVKQNFKENKFEVILRRKDTETICLPEGFTIVSEKENKNEETTFIISSDKENNPNILINYLTEKGTIVSYRELLPSINDIFINKVNGIM